MTQLCFLYINDECVHIYNNMQVFRLERSALSPQMSASHWASSLTVCIVGPRTLLSMIILKWISKEKLVFGS